MTNSQINLDIAVKALEANKLTGSAKSFIEGIRDYSKKRTEQSDFKAVQIFT